MMLLLNLKHLTARSTDHSYSCISPVLPKTFAPLDILSLYPTEFSVLKKINPFSRRQSGLPCTCTFICTGQKRIQYIAAVGAISDLNDCQSY
ncbi:hypothetical protein FKM82_012600 [Ascaphus truei]